jgi:ParB-like chromosome segregation protein Spo0J
MTSPKASFKTQSESPAVAIEDIAAEYVSLTRIHPWEKNPKPIEPKHVRELSRSIKRFGFGDPIVARKENGEIIAGHLRFAAARRLKLERVPVRFLDLSESEAHVMALAETKLERMRDFDDEQVAARLDELEEQGADLGFGTGFSDDDIDKLLEDGADSFDAGDEGGGATNAVGALRFQLLVTCKDDAQQAELLARLEGEGYECKPMMN